MPQGPRCMLVTLKAVTPIYFHGKYTRYKKHNDTCLQILSYKTLLFNTVTTIICTFLRVMNKSLHSMPVNFCTSSPELVFQVVVVTFQTHHPLPHCVHIHCLFSINIQQALNECNEYYFFV